MRYIILAGFLLGSLVVLVSCKDLLTKHNIDLDGVKHGEKLYRSEKNCTPCHGVNLNGNGPVPSCYSCHDALWSFEFHDQVRGGVRHRSGWNAESDCGGCHGGRSLKGSRSRPSCYECHGDVWTALAIHKVNKEGVYHGIGLDAPLDNCVSCHGSDLRGDGSAPSCYKCHGNVWDGGGGGDD